MVAIPPTPDEPKVACNSGARTFYSTPKRCNSNDVMSTLEIHARELHATFLRNHNMKPHKGPKQKTAQAQKTPTARGERQPPHSRQPCARATTQHPTHPAPRPYTTSPSQHSQTPPRLGHANGDFTTIDTPPRRVAGVSHPYGRNSPHTPTHNRHPRPAQTPIAYDLHAHNNHTPPLHARPRLRHRDSATPTGGFTTIDTSPRRVAGVSQPYGRNSPHAPTHNHQPCARATTQHPAHPAPRPYTTSPPQHSQTPPRHHPRLSVNPSCAHTHTRTRCHPPHVQPPPQRRPRPPPNPSCKRVPNHGLVPHIMAFTCNNYLLEAA